MLTQHIQDYSVMQFTIVGDLVQMFFLLPTLTPCFHTHSNTLIVLLWFFTLAEHLPDARHILKVVFI